MGGARLRLAVLGGGDTVFLLGSVHGLSLDAVLMLVLGATGSG